MTRWRLLAAAPLFTLMLAAVGAAGSSSRGQHDQAPSLHEAILTDLAPFGQIRACLTVANTALNTRAPNTGELRGVSVDVTREIGVRLAVEVELIGYPTDAERNRAVAGGECDVIFTAVTPEALAMVDLTTPLLVVDNTILVPEGSSIRSMADVDHPGVRVSAVAGTPPDRALSQQLRYAELIRTESAEEGFGQLVAGEVDALAGNRPNAMNFADRLPGSRVLEDQFAVQRLALGLPKGRDAGLAFAAAFVEEAKESGFLADSLERSGTRGVSVAPPAESPGAEDPATSGTRPSPSTATWWG